MRKKLKLLITLIAIFVVGLFGMACSNPNEDGPALEEMRLTYNAYELELYDSFKLTCINYKDVEFSSKNESVVVVEADGRVTAVGEGVADVLVKKDTVEATCRVSVINNGLIPVVQVNVDDGINMNKGESLALGAQASFKGEILGTSFSFLVFR